MISRKNIEIKVKNGCIHACKSFIVPALVISNISIGYFVSPNEYIP